MAEVRLHLLIYLREARRRVANYFIIRVHRTEFAFVTTPELIIQPHKLLMRMFV